MIKLERTSVMNMENAIRGARNPMNSWGKSDSYTQYENVRDHIGEFIFGPNDLTLARKLVKAGSDHRKFLRQIFVSVDITAPLYWYKEFDTYKVATVANSCSTMHKIHAKEFTVADFSCEHLLNKERDVLDSVIEILNEDRMYFINTKDKVYWHNMIQMLPSSYNQLRTVTLNYETLLNIYHARKNHKLDEWHTVCAWIETLPYFKEMCLEDGGANGN